MDRNQFQRKPIPREVRTVLAGVETISSSFVAERSLSRWRAGVHLRGEALPGGGERGRPRALNAERERLLAWKKIAATCGVPSGVI